MKYLLCILVSYLIGSINPAYYFGKKKGINIKKEGSKNAGASNAVILLGKSIGAICALLDIGKACFAIRFCQRLFPTLANVFAVSGTACILGHIFPFYMKFKGGKGLACLGGVVLMYDLKFFFLFLLIEVIIALLTDYICFVPITASVFFPFAYGILTSNAIGALIFGIAAIVILLKHVENIKRIHVGREMRLSFLWNRDNEIKRVTRDNNDE